MNPAKQTTTKQKLDDRRRLGVDNNNNNSNICTKKYNIDTTINNNKIEHTPHLLYVSENSPLVLNLRSSYKYTVRGIGGSWNISDYTWWSYCLETIIIGKKTTTNRGDTMEIEQQYQYQQATQSHIPKYSWIFVLVTGQLLAFSLACGGAAQATLATDCHVSSPTFSVGLVYACLTFCLVPLFIESYRNNNNKKSSVVHNNTNNNNESDNVNDEPCHTGDGDANESNVLFVVNTEVSATTTSTTTTISTTAKEYTFFFGYIELATPAYTYLFMAVLDVYANYFTVLAFKYTTITSVTLLDAAAIPSAMILSRLLLQRRFNIIHYVGVTLCIIGVVFNLHRDYQDDNNTSSTESSDINFPNKMKGDILAFVGGIMFGAINTLGEVAVRNYGGPNEYIGMLGFFACIICTIQGFILNQGTLTRFVVVDDEDSTTNDIPLCSTTKEYMLLIMFVISACMTYLGAARFLQYSEATFLNLSFLTADLWSVIFSIFTLHIIPKPLFYIALIFTMSGVIVYEMAPSSERSQEHTMLESNHLNVENYDDDDDDNDLLENTRFNDTEEDDAEVQLT